jgi:hypothetical protein
VNITLNFEWYHYKNIANSMSFILKEPCSRLDLAPPSYSAAVAALYDPGCSPSCFATSDSVCRWLSDLLSANSRCEVSLLDGSFFVINSKLRLCAFISEHDVSSHMFHPFDVDAVFLLESNRDPLWLSHPNAHVARVLEGCGRSQIKFALDRAQCWYTVRASAHDFAALLSDLVRRKIEDISSLKTSDIGLLVGRSFDCASRSLLLFHYFSMCFGEDITRRLMVPEYTGSSPTVSCPVVYTGRNH